MGLRYTPAGLARLELKIQHESTQQEAGSMRQVRCVIPALALGAVAEQLARLPAGQHLQVMGFLAQRSAKIAQLVMHIENITVEFQE